MQFFQQQFPNRPILLNENIVLSTRPSTMIEDKPLRIHIGNIPFGWSDKHLREQFEIFGPVDDVEVVSNSQGSKGFGFLTFLRRRDGERAMQVKNGTIADGRKITVSLAVAKNHSIPSLLSTPPQTPGRLALQSLPINLSAPQVIEASPLSPEAPMWIPITPPSPTMWPLSTDPNSNIWRKNPSSISSSPLSMLFPPVSPSNETVTLENDQIKYHWKSRNNEFKNTDDCSCRFCPYCGRSIQS